MPILDINGRRVEVDESFLSLSPENQAKTVDEIAEQIGNTPQTPQEAPGRAEGLSGIPEHRDGVSGVSGQPQGSPEADPDEIVARGSILPLGRTRGGDLTLAMPGLLQDAFGAAKSAATLPGDVYAGKVDPLSPEAIERSAGLATLATPINPAVRAGAKAIPGVSRNVQKQKVNVPTREELKAAGKQGLEEFRASGLELPAKDMQNWSMGVMSELHQRGMGGEVAKKANKILKKLTKPPEGGFTTAADLHAIRRTLGNVKGDATEVAAAGFVRQRLDDFIEGLPASGAVDQAATAVFKRGRGDYAAFKRSQKLGKTEESAVSKAKRAHSGKNLDNTLRQHVGRIIDKGAKGFTPDEVAAMNRLVEGTRPANLARDAGDLLGGGGGLGMNISGGTGGLAGFVLGGPLGAAVGAVGLPVAGYGMKKLGGTMTRRGLRQLDETTRMRSPLYQERAAAAPTVAKPTTGAGNTLRALLLSGMIAPVGLPQVGMPAEAQTAPPPAQEQSAPEQKRMIHVPTPMPTAERLQQIASLYKSATPADQQRLREAIISGAVRGTFTRQGDDQFEYIRDLFSPESMKLLYEIFGPEKAEQFKEIILIKTLRPVN